jgi:hypothetical protein
LPDESKMTRVDLSQDRDREDFAFMKDQDEFTALEWEQREHELDRAWYDADEDGNIRYGGGNDEFEDFMTGGPTEEERAAQEDLMRKKK